MNIKSVWSIQAPSAIHIDAPPDVCMSLLNKAAHPSIERLHLRDAFAEGRRYFIEATFDGFRMMTTSKALISRRRTESLAILRAQVISAGEHGTSIVLRASLRPTGLLSAFWIPAGMVWLLWPVPWPRLFIVGLLTVIFAFAWAGLRYGAALEFTEMIYFIQKTFENVPKFAPVALPASSGTGDGNEDFDVLWDQFVRARQSET
jgi:hypothetical protein